MFALLAHGRPRERYLIGSMKPHLNDNRIRIGCPSTTSGQGSDNSLIVDLGCPCLSPQGVNPPQLFSLPSIRQPSPTYRGRDFVSPGSTLSGIRATASGCLSRALGPSKPVSSHTWSVPPGRLKSPLRSPPLTREKSSLLRSSYPCLIHMESHRFLCTEALGRLKTSNRLLRSHREGLSSCSQPRQSCLAASG